jgi:hypothetical protein
MIHPNQELNCTESSPSVSVSWFAILNELKKLYDTFHRNDEYF